MTTSLKPTIPDRAKARRGVLVLVLPTLCLACSIFKFSSGSQPATDSETTETTTLAPTDEPKREVVTRQCPDGLAIDASARTIDTRKTKDTPWEIYNKRKWSKNHRQPAPSSFALSSEDAVKRFISLEAEHPELVPAPYRERVQAHPRDVELRLEMANCELTDPTTRRRASYDAALALLLGADPTQANPALVESTRHGSGSDTTQSCDEGSSCGEGEVCDVEAGRCMTAMDLGITFVSEPELEMEDTLTRGLHALAGARTPASTDDDGVSWWGQTRLHHCVGSPKKLCSFRAYNAQGQTTVVEWDQRDGGSSKVTRPKMTKAQRERHKQQLKCWEATHSYTRSQCRYICDVYQRNAECHMDCVVHCSV